MRRRTVLAVLPMLCLGLLAARFAPAADDLLKAIPDTALGFVVVNHLAETDAKVQALGRQVSAPAPSILGLLRAKAGVKEGFDEKGTAAIVAMPGKDADAEPAVILFVPVTDYAKLIGQLHPKDAAAAIATVELWDSTFLVRKVGGYAVFAEQRHRDILEKKVGAGTPAAASLAGWQPWLADKDVAGVLTHHGVSLVSEKIQKGLASVRDMMGQMGDEAQPALMGLELYGKLFKAAEKELTAVALGVQYDKQGVLRLTKRAAFVAGGTAARFFSQPSAAKGNPLEGLPAGPFAFAFSTTFSSDVASSMVDVLLQMMKAAPKLYNLNKEQMDKFAQMMREMLKGMRGFALVLQVGKPDDSLYGAMLGITRSEDATAIINGLEKYRKVFAEIFKGTNVPMPVPETKKVQFDGLPGVEMSMNYSKMFGKNAPGMPPKVMDAFFGADGKMVTYSVVADKHTMVAGHNGKDLLRSALKVIAKSQPGLAADKEVAKTTALLPAGATCVGYWSPKGTIDLVNRMIVLIGVDPTGTFKLPEFSATPPIGFALTTAPMAVEVHTVVPAEVVKAIGTYVAKVRGM